MMRRAIKNEIWVRNKKSFVSLQGEFLVISLTVSRRVHSATKEFQVYKYYKIVQKNFVKNYVSSF